MVRRIGYGGMFTPDDIGSLLVIFVQAAPMPEPPAGEQDEHWPSDWGLITDDH